MNSRVHFLGKRVAIVSVFLVAIVLVACEQSKTPAPTSAAAASTPATEKVFVVFEGPWAIVADPKDANSILALAPKTKVHNDLYVAASNESPLPAGTYDLSVPAHGPAASGALDPTFAQAKIDSKSLQHALDDKSGRYVVRLPKPEAYVAARRFLSRVGATYPPDASTEQNYVTFVSLRYSVGSLNGFSLSGSPDTGTFNPLLLQLDTPTIRFAIEQPDAPPDTCHTHSRSAFRDTVKFLGLKLYVDFPNDSANCHKTDPQSTGSARAEAGPTSPLERAVAFMRGDLIEAETADSNADTMPRNPTILAGKIFGRSARNLMTAFIFFHATDGGCRAPILFLTTTP
jgi:hypothetical protein